MLDYLYKAFLTTCEIHEIKSKLIRRANAWGRDAIIVDRAGFKHVRGVPPHWGLHQIMEFRGPYQPKKLFNNYLLQPWTQV